MNIFNNIYNNENEKEDDWGWFIRLDLDTTTSTVETTTCKKVNHMCKSLQTIEENEEYYETSNNSENKIITKINTYVTLKTKYDFFKKLLFYGLLYNCVYLDYIYKCINPFSFYKHKTCN
uniref:Uncharacterized protein n=1 Tax=viral metagenome TaxID=1070528 RepID=A0A6C0EFC9_9ZZZZ